MAQLQQMQQNLENGVQHEEIPLNRTNSAIEREEREERIKIRRIFDSFDLDRDGYIDLKELKNLIKSQQCQQLPKGLARQIMKQADTDGDRRLDFDEFFVITRHHSWLVTHYAIKYCQLLVPAPRREEDEVDEETGVVIEGGVVDYQSIDFRDGQYENSMSFCPPPLTMVIFSIVEIIMFLVDIIYFDEHKSKDIQTIGLSTKGPAATLFIYNPYKREEVWRFLSYMFVHVGIMHITMNLIVQIFLGVALELVHSWWRVALVYVAGVVAGSIGTSITSPNIFLAGASGGVYALITAHVATIIMNWHEMEYAIIQLFVFIIFITTDVGSSIYRSITDVNDQVGYMAHLSGALAGLLVGIGVLRNLKVRPWEKKLWWFAVTVYSLLMLTGICIHIFYPSHFPLKPKLN